MLTRLEDSHQETGLSAWAACLPVPLSIDGSAQPPPPNVNAMCSHKVETLGTYEELVFHYHRLMEEDIEAETGKASGVSADVRGSMVGRTKSNRKVETWLNLAMAVLVFLYSHTPFATLCCNNAMLD